MITLDQLSNFTALDTSFATVMKKSNMAGIDGITPIQFAENRKRNLQEISWAIKAGVFSADPVLQFEINKHDKTREIGILTTKDRIVARTFHKALTKLIEPFLDESCFAFRSDRSALLAAQSAESLIKKGFIYVAKADVQDFFSTINRELLLSRLEPLLENEEVGRILKELIEAPVTVNQVTIESSGLSLGSPLSPVLSNYYLCGIDNYFGKSETVKYLRYVDDILLLGKDEQPVKNAISELETLLADVFLELNPQKTVITSIDSGFDYLGFRFDEQGITASAEAELALLAMLEEEWEICRFRPKDERLAQLKQKLDGWNAYYQGKIAGGLLGVLIHIAEEKFDAEAIWAYRQSLDSDDIEKIVYLSEAWQNRGRLDYALNEFSLYFNLPVQEYPEETAKQLIHLFKAYFGELNSDVLGSIIEIYTQLEAYAIAEKLSERLCAAKSQIELNTCDGLGYNQDEIGQFRKTFIQRENEFSVEVYVDNERRFSLQQRYVSDELIKRHLAGEITLDGCVIDEQLQTTMLVLDIDVLKEIRLKVESDAISLAKYEEESHRYGQEILKTAGDLGLKAYLENTGGFGRHVWLFFNEKIDHLNIAQLGKRIVELAGALPEGLSVEIFPSGRSSKVGTAVSIIKLPFGVNVVTKKRSFFYGDNKMIYPNWRNFQHECVINDHKLAKKHVNIAKKLIKADPGNQFNDDYARLLPLAANVEQIIQHCAIMRRLALKALDTRFLNHFERLALLYVFGHLGDEGALFLHKMIANTMDYNKKTTDYFIGKRPDLPVGCSKLKEELSYLGSDACHCRFKVPKGCYFSPVLHAIAIDTFGSEDSKITLPVAKESKKDQVIEFFSSNQRLEEKIAEVLDISRQIKDLENQKDNCKEAIKKILHRAEEKIISVELGTARINEDGELEISLKL